MQISQWLQYIIIGNNFKNLPLVSLLALSYLNESRRVSRIPQSVAFVSLAWFPSCKCHNVRDSRLESFSLLDLLLAGGTYGSASISFANIKRVCEWKLDLRKEI